MVNTILIMIDIKHIIQQPELFTEELERRAKDVTIVETLIEQYNDWKIAQSAFETRRHEQKQISDTISTLTGDEKMQVITDSKLIAVSVKELEAQAKSLHAIWNETLPLIPNLTWGGSPVGKDDSANVITGEFNPKPIFNFEPQPYYELEIFKRDYDGTKGVQAAGFRGYYIKGNLARLYNGLFQWATNRLIAEGFEYMVVPMMVQEELLYGTGFFPTGRDDVYEAYEGDTVKYIPGTSEASLVYYLSNKTHPIAANQPIKLTAMTTCYRKEVGAHGKDTKGGIRVHQFDKVETVLACRPEDSAHVFEYMTQVFHGTLDLLGLHYHDLEVSTGDMSMKNHRQVDIEAWFPGLGEYRELASSSNCTAYQAQNLRIKCFDSEGNEVIAHTLNCTGIVARTVWAIMEQYQQEDGSVVIPPVLRDYVGFEVLR